MGGRAVGVVLLLSPTFHPALVVVFPAWVGVLCAVLLTRTVRLPAELPGGAPATGFCIARIRRPDKRKDTSTDQVVMRRWDSAKTSR